MTQPLNVNRRDFLKSTTLASAGLVLGFYLPSQARFAQAEATKTFMPNAFLRITEDNVITVLIKHAEMGQGVTTSLPMLVAEELEADWTQIRYEFAPATPAYVHTAFGMQMTGGSSSVSNSYEQLRTVGATAKTMLINAAANKWSVDPASCKAENSQVIHAASQRNISYGELVEHAAKLSAPESVTLKSPDQFKVIGQPTNRIDSPQKVNGTAQFGIDVKQPNMLMAVIARPPVFGGKVKSFNADQAKAISGVQQVVQISAGVAVVAENFWQAKKGRDALEIEWDLGDNANVSTAHLLKDYHALAEKPGPVAADQGNAAAAIKTASKTITAEYEFPFLAHAAMEPLNCVAHVTADKCEIWTGSQFQTVDQQVVAQITGLKPEQITIHTTLLGGGFGRRANKNSDFIAEAAELSKALNGQMVQVVWTREDDMRGGYYRPMYVHHVTAGVDAEGHPHVWQQRIVGQSIVANTPFEQFLVKDGIDATSVEGADDLPYGVPNFRVEYHQTVNPVPTLWWRAVGHTHTAFVAEAVIDELAALAEQDPVAYRLKLLKDHPRHAKVLELVAEKSGWDKPLPAKEGVRRGRGVAVHYSFYSYAAEVVEVSVQPDGQFSIDRVVCAIDCGTAVNPRTIHAQMESAILYGLTAALYGEITIEAGKVKQGNYDTYRAMHMRETPPIETHIVASAEPPTGVGEPGTPPAAPALCNALYQATQKRIRTLPINTDLLKMA